MNQHNVNAFIPEEVARKAAQMRSARLCRICLSPNDLVNIYTGDLERQQLIEAYSAQHLRGLELPQFICTDCEDAMLVAQYLKEKRDESEAKIRAFVYGNGQLPAESSSNNIQSSNDRYRNHPAYYKPLKKELIILAEADSTTEVDHQTEDQDDWSVLSQNLLQFPGRMQVHLENLRQEAEPSGYENDFGMIHDLEYEEDLDQARRLAVEHEVASSSEDEVELINEYNINDPRYM